MCETSVKWNLLYPMETLAITHPSEKKKREQAVTWKTIFNRKVNNGKLLLYSFSSFFFPPPPPSSLFVECKERHTTHADVST